MFSYNLLYFRWNRILKRTFGHSKKVITLDFQFCLKLTELRTIAHAITVIKLMPSQVESRLSNFLKIYRI